jgi:isopentenyl-diphosphate delta-isomerase
MPVSDILQGYDAEQVRLMREMCIQLDKDDKPLGGISKKDAHLMTNINDGILHRAFSVFLFNTKGELLLQQRADEKITFPGCYTNTCCSHPLMCAEELVEENQKGVKVAAIRKLEQELGIAAQQLPMDAFTFLTRIHYMAPSDGLWGEHEIDYILFIQKDVDVTPNPNEVQSYRYVSQSQLRTFLAEAKANGHKITPWFNLIADTFLWSWWEKLDTIASVGGDQTIHRL